MIERRGGLGLVHEADPGLVVAGHHPHPALAELLENPIVRDRFSDHGKRLVNRVP